MEVIESKEQIIQNIFVLESYLCEGTGKEKLFATNLVKRGRCFLAYKVDGKFRFAPSRFIGYENNNMNKHERNSQKDGTITNPAIIKCLGTKNEENSFLKEEHHKYCKDLGVNPDNVPKVTFWKIDLEENEIDNNLSKVEKSFPEGNIIERIHLKRERNSKVVEIAKREFKQKHGKLFCIVCKFDFKEQYGDIGEDFIEGHHTKPISEMKPDEETKPEDIAMVCSNCHRMLHRKRPWLSMNELSDLLDKRR